MLLAIRNSISFSIMLLGSLGIFIYGMKLMSESLEKAAGNNLKNLLSSMTSNKFFGVFTGFLVTSIIQSSSATTVMVVSFVNAGLLNLAQAIGIIMGANIGTTLTAWIVNLTNIKFDILLWAYLAIIIGIIFLFLRYNKLNNWGNVLLGFAFIFIGLAAIKKIVPSKESLTQTNFIIEFLSSFPTDKYWAYFIFILFGTLFTVILQSSSATMAVTIMLLNQGYITFNLAAAMVLGENIGTTITANLASLAGNRMAKKAALSHTIFNLAGVIWMMIVFKPFLNMCVFLSKFAPLVFKQIEGVQLAVFHSFFNITNTFLFIWFVPQIQKIINFIYGQEKKSEKTGLLNIKFGIISTPDLALLEAQNEIQNMGAISRKAFNKTCELFTATKKQDKIHQKIKSLEEDLDNYEKEIYSFLLDLLKEDTSVETTDKINASLDIIRNLEWIGDSCEMIAGLYKKASDNNYEIPTGKEEHFNKIQLLISDFFELFIDNINNLKNPKIIKDGFKIESNINSLYKKMKKKTINNMRASKKHVASGLLFMDMIKELEHIGDALKNIIQVYHIEKTN